MNCWMCGSNTEYSVPVLLVSKAGSSASACRHYGWTGTIYTACQNFGTGLSLVLHYGALGHKHGEGIIVCALQNVPYLLSLHHKSIHSLAKVNHILYIAQKGLNTLLNLGTQAVFSVKFAHEWPYDEARVSLKADHVKSDLWLWNHKLAISVK